MIGAFATRVDLQKVRAFLAPHVSAGLRMAPRDSEGRRFSSPWGTGFLKRASWNLGWHLGDDIQEVAIELTMEVQHVPITTDTEIDLEMTWNDPNKLLSLDISSMTIPIPETHMPRRNAGSSGFFGWFRRFCRRLPPCMASLVSSAGHPTSFSKVLTRRSRTVEHLPFLATWILAPNSTELDFITVWYCLHLLLFYHVWITFHRFTAVPMFRSSSFPTTAEASRQLLLSVQFLGSRNPGWQWELFQFYGQR